SFGVELERPSVGSLAVTGFLSAQKNVTDLVAGCLGHVPCQIVERIDGSTYGLEVLVKRPITKRFSGWISYTLSRVTRTYQGIPLVSAFDRSQSFAGVGLVNFGSGYRAGLRGTYYSGRPAFPELSNGVSNYASFSFRPGDAFEHRLPDFF